MTEAARELRVLLRAARAKNHHNQRQAARAIGVRQATWSAWERGRAFPTTSNVGVLADYAQTDPERIERLRPTLQENSDGEA